MLKAAGLIMCSDFHFHGNKSWTFGYLLLRSTCTLATPISGHSLDWFITRADKLYPVNILEIHYLLSDHFSVICSTPIVSQANTLREKRYDKVNDIDIETFKNDVKNQIRGIIQNIRKMRITERKMIQSATEKDRDLFKNKTVQGQWPQLADQLRFRHSFKHLSWFEPTSVN